MVQITPLLGLSVPVSAMSKDWPGSRLKSNLWSSLAITTLASIYTHKHTFTLRYQDTLSVWVECVCVCVWERKRDSSVCGSTPVQSFVPGKIVVLGQKDSSSSRAWEKNSTSKHCYFLVSSIVVTSHAGYRMFQMGHLLGSIRVKPIWVKSQRVLKEFIQPSTDIRTELWQDKTCSTVTPEGSILAMTQTWAVSTRK